MIHFFQGIIFSFLNLCIVILPTSFYAFEKVFEFWILTLFYYLTLNFPWQLSSESPSAATVGLASAFGVCTLLFYLCYFADIVTTHTEMIGFHLWQCKWYFWSRKSQQFYLMILMRSQRRIVFNGYKIIDCTMETFGKVRECSIRNRPRNQMSGKIFNFPIADNQFGAVLLLVPTTFRLRIKWNHALFKVKITIDIVNDVNQLKRPQEKYLNFIEQKKHKKLCPWKMIECCSYFSPSTSCMNNDIVPRRRKKNIVFGGIMRVCVCAIFVLRWV